MNIIPVSLRILYEHNSSLTPDAVLTITFNNINAIVDQKSTDDVVHVYGLIYRL